MRQILRFPANKRYKFGLTHGGGLEVRNGDFVSEEKIKTYQISEQYLEKAGKEKKNWDNEMLEGTDRIMFEIETSILGGDEFEKKRMVDQFKVEFKDYIRQKGLVVFKVLSVSVIKKRKKKNKRTQS